MKRAQLGLSLIELMVSLALGLIITLGVTNIFISARSTYLMQNSSAAMQEDARYFLSRITQELRMTGMFGCLASVTDSSTNLAFTTAFNTPISYTVGTNTVLTLTTADVGSAGTSPTWTVVSDCLTTATAYTGTATVPTGQMAFPIHQTTYTFNSTNSTISTGTGTGQQVLLNNVTGFSLLFGLASSASDSDTTVVSYSTTPSSPGLVRSVRITLTLKDPTSNTNAALASQTFNVVASIRNRML